MVSSFAQIDALAKLLIEKGCQQAGVFAEGFRGAGYLSEDVQPDGALKRVMESVLLEGVTLAVIIFGAVPVYLLQRWRSPSPLGNNARALAPVQCVAFGVLSSRLDRKRATAALWFFLGYLVLGINVVLVTKVASKLFRLRLSNGTAPYGYLLKAI
jgi:hypothetical protein